jgi:antitoxin component YwqK of YwqJK toxin-antitoxin module|tara:strand:+ start:420 stop:860 length:441 start_codon:yes stop_codon:yes gene_type:complete
MIKKLLPLLLLILIGCSSPEPINIETMLIERNDVYYTKDTNQPYSGPVFSLNENGQLQEELVLKDGELDGTYKSYYENGQLESEGTNKNGQRDGPYKSYYQNGQLFQEVTFKDGQVDGLWKYYNDNGQLQEERTYKDSELIDSKEY